ncbi:MAG: hypothetical protein DI536_11155 [Archangium gephyra]|uniref:Lipoprotein n=1 Tax=Archangium gephyra TaxID=48 RepID=A0A2W5TGK3_9BACT|nr:MAG: hypothetical protein DI536_11155 [Archangium gephyra]
MRWLALSVLIAASGCVGLSRRAEFRAQTLRERYATTGIPVERARFIEQWERRDKTIYLGCARLDEPCRGAATEPDTFCFVWGAEKSCFKVTEHDGRTFLARADKTEAKTTEEWVFARLDPEFQMHDAEASALAEVKALEEEQPPENANSFWFNARATLQLLATNVGLQLQGGYRRWFEHYFLLSVGGGYERSVVRTDSGMGRDSVLFTTRLEFSTFDQHTAKRANLPGISAWVGITGVLGVEPDVSWTTRTFVGLSAIVPFSFEFGYAVTFIDRDRQLGNVYIATGLGF